MDINSPKGTFIAFEGIDGSGKSTQLKLLAERLEMEGRAIHKTMEPTDGPIGTLLRRFLTGALKTDERTIAALFAADRLDHLLGAGGLKEIINAGVNVVTDRYYLSSYAYQSTAMPLEWVVGINSESARILKPDCHIFIDIKPETAIERISGGRGSAELFETLERLTAVRSRYFEIFNKLKDAENVIVVNGEMTQEEVAAEILKALGNAI